MTKLEKEYRSNIGKLFIHRDRQWTGANKGWALVSDLVMIDKVEKQGGWYHYRMEIIKRNLDNIPDIQDGRTKRITSCRDFHRHCDTPLSLLGDTKNKEVAQSGEPDTMYP
jgi:hypothetical protein